MSRDPAADDPRATSGRGRLVLVVGPSGVGKDSILKAAALAHSGSGVVFPRRSITRAPDPTEDCESLSPAEFGERVRTGGFALSWRAHDLSYGIPASIDGMLADGRHVVCNVSRTVVGEARRRFPGTLVVEIAASRAAIEARLAARGREAADERSARLARASAWPDGAAPDVSIDNSGPLEDAVGRLLDVLRSL